MPRRDTAERDAEFERFKRFILALAEFLDADAVTDPRPSWTGELGPDGQVVWKEHRGPPVPMAPMLREAIASLDRQRPRGWRAGIREGLQDLLEMSRELSPQKVQLADSHLKAAGAPTLSTMRAEIWRTIPKLIMRGRSKTESEYYLLVERLNDATGAELTQADRYQIAEMVAEFEHRRGEPR